ncbi:MAG: class I SAM-dependent methyltransferase [Candidatus Omnitrophota bacterium]|nr:class I SAM-dependent methyltransferase [Candidatus Omnitrophota bacterium]
MSCKKYFCGNKMERIPDAGFKMMSFIFRLKDVFSPPEGRLDGFEIKEGFTVIDYGCGPGRYLRKASQLVGPNGRVYAADIHKLAIKAVKEKIEKYNLKNVIPVLVKGYSCNIGGHTADMIYALDMFHMIKEPDPFLKELHRLLKKDGFLIIDDGHQPRNEAKMKIAASGIWDIAGESRHYLTCIPVSG